MKCKKLLAFVLALVMMLSMLTACGNNDDEPVVDQPQKEEQQTAQEATEAKKEIVFPLEEPLNVSAMMIMGNSAYSYNDNVAWNYLQETSNIHFDIMEFPPSEAQEKMNLLLSGGQYTDILFKANKIDLNKYGMDGILIPLEDLIREYCPNLTAILDERNGWGTITAADGHVYALPSIQHTNQNAGTGSAFWINQGWLDAVGETMPTNKDELYNVLKAFKEKDPNGNGKQDEIPFTPDIAREHGALSNLIGYFGDGLWFGDYWMDMGGEMEYLPTTEYFKEDVLKYFKKLYDEGLLAEDAFTFTREQLRASCGSEEVVYGMLYDSSCVYFADPEEYKNWYTLKPFDGTNFALNNGVMTGAFAITDKCENPEILMAWVDQLYTEEGGRIIRHGVEGVSYTLYEDGTYEQITEGYESNVYQTTLMGSSVVPGILPDLFYNGNREGIPMKQTNHELYADGYGAWDVGVICPSITYTEDEYDTYSILFTDINSYVCNYVAEAVTGIVSIDETWDEFQSTLQAMQVEEMIAIQRDAYARAKAN